MNILLEKCLFLPLEEAINSGCDSFDCGNPDLNDFFNNDAINYSNELLGKSHCFVLEEDKTIIVCAFTVSNDKIDTKAIPGSRKKRIAKNIPRGKHMKHYPAVLIGRLGVNKKFHRDKIGTYLMCFIKSWFVDYKNKTGCRYIVVDSYNEDSAISYYKKNEFDYIFSSEEQEIEHTGSCPNGQLTTRLMYFDLIQLINK